MIEVAGGLAGVVQQGFGSLARGGQKPGPGPRQRAELGQDEQQHRQNRQDASPNPTIVHADTTARPSRASSTTVVSCAAAVNVSGMMTPPVVIRARNMVR